jgi:hypothetical protein
VAAEIWRYFEGADIVGYNALGFHVPLLAAEFARLAAGSISSPVDSSAEDTYDFKVITMNSVPYIEEGLALTKPESLSNRKR